MQKRAVSGCVCVRRRGERGEGNCALVSNERLPPVRRFEQRGAAEAEMQSQEAQAESETADPVHDAAAAVAGEEVPGEAVPVDSGAGGVLQQSAPDRDAGEDLVPEPAGEGEAAAGGGDREAEDGRGGGRAAAPSLRAAASPCAAAVLSPSPRASRGGALLQS